MPLQIQSLTSEYNSRNFECKYLLLFLINFNAIWIDFDIFYVFLEPANIIKGSPPSKLRDGAGEQQKKEDYNNYRKYYKHFRRYMHHSTHL